MPSAGDLDKKYSRELDWLLTGPSLDAIVAEALRGRACDAAAADDRQAMGEGAPRRRR